MNSFIENEDIESRYGEELYEDFTNYQKLQARIDKAIEYIEHLKEYPFLERYYVLDLLKILKGEDKE